MFNIFSRSQLLQVLLALHGVHLVTGSHVIFNKIGTTSHALEYANVEININISHTTDALKTLRDALIKKAKTETEGTSKWQHRQFMVMEVDRLLIRCDHLMQMTDKLPAPQPQLPNRRHKRFIFSLAVVAILAAVTAGTAYGLYRNSELYSMHSNVNTLKAAEAVTIRELNKMGDSNAELLHLIQGTETALDEYYEEIETSKWDENAIKVGTRRVCIFEETVAAVMQQRIAPSTLAELNTTAIANDVNIYAKQNGMIPMASHFTDWLQIPASFSTFNDGFQIFLHIPLSPPEATMNLYRHIKLPLPLDDNYHITLDTAADYFAITQDGTIFKAISEAELQECRHVGEFYSCDRGNTARVRPNSLALRRLKDSKTQQPDADLCLWALHSGDQLVAKHACDSHIVPVAPSVIMITPTKFATYNPSRHQAKMMCRNPDTPHKKRFMVDKLTMIDVPTGCTVFTDTHVLSSGDAAFSREASQWAIEYNWKLDIQDITNGLNMSAFHQLRIAADGTTSNMSRIRLDQALNSLRHIKNTDTSVGFSHWWTIPSASSIILVAIILILAIYVIRTKKQKSGIQATTSQPSAPLAINLTSVQPNAHLYAMPPKY